MSSRSRVRRVCAAIVGALLLQLMLLGSGVPCAARGGGAMDSHAMAGHESAPAPAGAPCITSSTDDCRMPQAPGPCGAMTTCALTTAIAEPIAFGGAHRVNIPGALPVPPSLASRPATAPELPPPRA